MKLTRLGNKKDLETTVEVIVVEVQGVKYRIMEKFGQVEINTDGKNLAVHPS